MLISSSEKDNKAASNLLSELLSVRNDNGSDGWPSNFRYYYLMHSLLAVFRNKITQSDLMTILQGLDKKLYSEDNILMDVDKLYTELIAKAKQGTSKYEFISEAPFNLQGDQSELITLFGNIFTLSSWNITSNNGLRDDSIPELRMLVGFNGNMFWGSKLSCPINLWHENSGYHFIRKDYELIRGITEFISSYKNFTFHYGTSKPRNAIGHGRWMYFGNEKSHSIRGFCVKRINQSSIDFSGIFRENFYKISGKMANEIADGKSIINMISDCFRLYSFVQEEEDDSKMLLCWWQIIERMALSDRCNGDTKEVCDRFLRLFPGSSSDYVHIRYFFRMMADKRNSIVHSGSRNNVDQDELFILKSFIDSAINFILKISDKIKTENQLDIYYRNYSANSTNLSDSAMVFDILINDKLLKYGIT
jgi:hypothetical protein